MAGRFLIGLAGAIFSAGMATMHVIMTTGYPQSCRSAGIGFGIFMSRVGAISASLGGGFLLELGQGSVLPFFATLTLGAVLISAGAFIVDRHVPGTRRPPDVPIARDFLLSYTPIFMTQTLPPAFAVREAGGRLFLTSV